MDSVAEVHSKFLYDLFQASKIFPYQLYSAFPCILFLISIFALVYIQFKKYSNSLSGWKIRLCKHLIFHWTYFYTSRIWFLFLRVCRWAVQYSDKTIERNYTGDEAYYNKIITRFWIFMLVFSISLVPCLILYVGYLNRREIPNFLMWAAEDPWITSEIGPSGHYLERPPRPEIYGPHKRNASYRSGRSSSVDTNVFLEREPSFLRPCKSAISVKKSIERNVS